MNGPLPLASPMSPGFALAREAAFRSRIEPPTMPMAASTSGRSRTPARPKAIAKISGTSTTACPAAILRPASRSSRPCAKSDANMGPGMSAPVIVTAATMARNSRGSEAASIVP